MTAGTFAGVRAGLSLSCPAGRPHPRLAPLASLPPGCATAEVPARPSSLHQSPSAEPLGSFQFLAIINNTAMNISVQITFLVSDWEAFPKWNYEVKGREQFCSSCHMLLESSSEIPNLFTVTPIMYGWSLQPTNIKVHCFLYLELYCWVLIFPSAVLVRSGAVGLFSVCITVMTVMPGTVCRTPRPRWPSFALQGLWWGHL